MSKVFVLDTNRQPLDPVHPGYARLLLKRGRAAVWRRFPFTIMLNSAVASPQVEPLRLKLDPGSKTTGIAVLNDASGEVVFAAELRHRGHQISKSLARRRAVRRSRRQRKTRYRKPRFSNRRNQKPGWLPPSLHSRISNVLTWVQRLSGLCSITAISLELVKFDLQQMDNPEISGIEYQQGVLAGYEIREYLLEIWGRQCAYCAAKDVPLEIEHISPRVKSHDDRVCNLTLACHPCNEKKAAQDIRAFLKHKPNLLQKMLAQAKAPLKDAAAVNASRWALYRRLQALGLPIECGSGGLTKYNRTVRGLPKAHWTDAACVGRSTPEILNLAAVSPIVITAQGHGCRQVTNVDRFGFPRGKPKQRGRSSGFKTGDLVRAVVPSGKKVGTYTGRVLVRASGSFDIQTKAGRVQGISARYCHPLHRSDGYSYQKGTRFGTNETSLTTQAV
ncbi:MAG TPA: RNA-guided endonuclease IscB [Ktedonobacteraceae bacterium]|nr:RNA-guided endonuclease IscB [Ktedonobacteraceae bacterium]